jgi:hypothetical protein
MDLLQLLGAGSRVTVQETVEHASTRRLADGRSNSGDRSVVVFLNIHTLMIGEALFFGKLYIARPP